MSAKGNGQRGILRLYSSYSFRDKDPGIDESRTAVRDSGMSYREVSEASGVSVSTLYGWYHGKTLRPSHACHMAVLHACGYGYKLVRLAKVIQFERRRRTG